MTNSVNTTQAQANGSKFIDFITYGTGIVNRIRYVTGRRLKTPALYCTIAVPLDDRSVRNGRWVNFDVRVLGRDNIALIESMMPAVTEGKRPRVHFSIGDAYADAFWKQSGDDRTPRAQFKGRLLRVSEAKQDPQRELLSYGMAYINGLDHARTKLDTCVLHGSLDAIEKNYTTVVLPKERDVELDKALDAVIAGGVSQAKVLAGVVLRDMQCSAFIFRDGSQNAGEIGTNVNAVLSAVRWVKVEGEMVYRAPKQQAQESTQEPAAQAANPEVPDQPVASTPSQDLSEEDDDQEEFVSRHNHAYGFDDMDDQIPF